MVKKIIEYCAKNIFVVFVLTGLIILWSIWAIYKTRFDALPDLSDTQVIIFTEWSGRSPTLIEDQITYPIATTFLNASKVKTVRGFTMFSMSFVFVLFEDGTDIYWARSRAIEYLNTVKERLPEGVNPIIGPDATGVGWVYEYALVDESGKYSLQELRSFQDWYLRYWLSSVPGVAEVASIGGYEKEYQVEIDPVKLQAYKLSLSAIKDAIRKSNNDVGGRVIELAEHEYAVRGRGYITDKTMLEQVVVGTDEKGTPILIKDIARVQIGGRIRRGLAELNGEGEVAGAIVVMRYGENALAVIDRVKTKIKEMESAFPKGVKLVPTYDRSELIKGSIKTLNWALAEEIIIILLVIMLFLWHFWSSFVSFIALVVTLLMTFIPMYYMGITSNILSLAGIIIALGDVIDAAIVMTENAHRKLEENKEKSRTQAIIEAAKEIGPGIFGSLVVTVIAFLPVFTLQAQEGRLFLPLAYTKTFAVAFGALIGITLVPALMMIFIRGKIKPALQNPINKFFVRGYKPLLQFFVGHRYLVALFSLVLILATVPIYLRLGSEFMPPLDEGTILFMPITVPGISIEKVKELMQMQNKLLKKFPEVKRVFGKAGKSTSPTDPAPLSMIETVIELHPKSQWRKGMTKEKLVTEMEKTLNFPGVQNAFTMPIKARIDMLTTGIRTPIGIKLFGSDLEKINSLVIELENIIRQVPGTRSVYAERELGGFYIDFVPDRAAIARYGLRLDDIFDVIETSIGGLDIATTIEGRERYKINVRYPRELRGDIERLKKVLVPISPQKTSSFNKEAIPDAMGRVEHVPLELLGHIHAVMGPPMIKDEMGSLSGWVYVDTGETDIGGFVEKCKKAVAEKLKLPEGYFLKWTGQYEYLERMQAMMKIVIPLTLILILLVLFFNFHGLVQALIVMLSVPFAALGSMWFLTALRYNVSVAVWVGIIALLGIAAQTATIMVLYLDEGFLDYTQKGEMKNINDLINMTVNYGSTRIRPILMAVGMNILGLIPILLSEDVGADVAQRISAPLWGGLITLTISTLLVIPAMYVIWRGRQLKKKFQSYEV